MSASQESILPIELERVVVSFAMTQSQDKDTFSSIRLTCQRWNSFCCSEIRSITISRLPDSSGATALSTAYRSCARVALSGSAQVDPEFLNRFQNLNELDLSKCSVGDAGICRLAQVPSLEILRLNAAGCSTPVLNAVISNMPNLKELFVSIEGLKLTPSTLFCHPCLQRFQIKPMEYEHLFVFEITESVFTAFKKLSSVPFISIAVESDHRHCGMRLLAPADNALTDTECRFVVGSGLRQQGGDGSAKLLFWAGPRADNLTKLAYQSVQHFLIHVFPALQTHKECNSFAQVCDIIPIGPEVVGEA